VVGGYEQMGRFNGRMLAQAERYPALEPYIRSGRSIHQAWIREHLAAFLSPLTSAARERLLFQLYTLTDYYTWYLYRHVYGQSREETEDALLAMIGAVLPK
jgi:hypothetical protein